MQRLSDIVVCGADGMSSTGLVYGQTTTIGINVEYQGAAVTLTTMALTIRAGANSITPTVNIATAGEARASVTSANLTSLGLTGVLQSAMAFWDGTYLAGTNTYVVRMEMPLVVVDQPFRWPALYADFADQIPQLSNSAALPSGQTSFFPQVALGWRLLLSRLRAKNWFTRPSLMVPDDELWLLAFLDGCASIYDWMSRADNRQSGLAAEAKRFRDERESLFKEMAATVKTGTEEFNSTADPGRRAVKVDQGPTYADDTAGFGGYGGAL